MTNNDEGDDPGPDPFEQLMQPHGVDAGMREAIVFLWSLVRERGGTTDEVERRFRELTERVIADFRKQIDNQQ